MKKFLLIICLSVGSLLCAAAASPVSVPVAVAVPDVHPTEAKYDKIMNNYAVGLKAAFAEKDDKKTIVLVNKLNDEMITALEKIKPELERWVKGMSEQDKEAFANRAESKPYLKAIFEIMFNPEIGKRIEQNPELKQAIEAGNKRMKALGFGGEDETDAEEDLN